MPLIRAGGAQSGDLPSGEARPGEFELIARYFRPLAARVGTYELLDDAAALTVPGGYDLVMSVDMLAAGVHFFAEDSPASIARKALGVNLSDLAAKGADPIGYLVSLALPSDWTEAWVANFSDGLKSAQEDFGLALYGGDTIKSNGGLQISVTVVGKVPKGRMVQRGAARAGEAIYVSGAIGDAALGLQLRLKSQQAIDWGLSPRQKSYLHDRYLHPCPRIELIQMVRNHASAAMDISDGLLGDLAKMSEVSDVSAVIDVSRVPLSDAVQAAVKTDASARLTALTGGDDYELLMSVAPDRQEAVETAARHAGVALTSIGTFEQEGPPVRLRDADGQDVLLDTLSFAHF